MRPVVTIVYRHVPQYRVEFYEGLRAELDKREIDLRLLYGQPIGEDRRKRDAVELSWGEKIQNRTLSFGRRVLCYQPVLASTRDSDLVVVEQASKLLVNYLLLARARVSGPRVCLWGHGENLQADGSLYSRVAERLKRVYTKSSSHFFAYTASSADRVKALGVAESRITVVQNSIDVSRLRRQRSEVTAGDVAKVVADLGSDGRYVCAFVGALYEEKKLDLLLEAGAVIDREVQGFKCLVIGDGPQRAAIEASAKETSWLEYLGPRFGDEKVKLLASSRLILIPGLVGLVVLDSFALGVPMVTTDYEHHSPEFDYLEPGENGLVTASDPLSYAAGVLGLLKDEKALARLTEGCFRSSKRYSVENMVGNFADGIEAALRM